MRLYVNLVSRHRILAINHINTGKTLMMQTCTLSLIVIKDDEYNFRQQGENSLVTGTGIFQFRGREDMEFASIPFSARNLSAELIESQNTDKVLCTCKGYITFEENIPLFNIEDAEIAEINTEPQPETQIKSEFASKPTAKSQGKTKPQFQPQSKSKPVSKQQSEAELTAFESSFQPEMELNESEYTHIPF